MNENEMNFEDIEEKIAKQSGDSIEKIREEYDKIIKTSHVNKEGEELYLLRKITSKEFIKGYYKNKGIYSIYTKEGKYSGFIEVTVSNNNKANEAEIEYLSEKDSRDKGNITISLEEVLFDIFINNSFDNLTIKDIFPKTKIEEVFLSISSDNYASQAVANKLRFQKNNREYIMTKEQFRQIMQRKKITEQEIGKGTLNVKVEEKDNSKIRINSDMQEMQIKEK